jgi:hypothetical protein
LGEIFLDKTFDIRQIWSIKGTVVIDLWLRTAIPAT